MITVGMMLGEEVINRTPIGLVFSALWNSPNKNTKLVRPMPVAMIFSKSSNQNLIVFLH